MPDESSSSSSESSVPLYSTLQRIITDSYASGTAPDMTFTQADLINGRLRVPGVLPGGAAIVNGSGTVVNAAQTEIRDGSGTCTGTEYDLSGSTISGTWTVRFIRGQRGPEGQATDSVPPDDDMLLYALIFN